jgi:cysteine desulfurase
MKRIYLDNAATTPVAQEVTDKVCEISANYYGNPSSIHTIGQEAKKIVDEGRRMVANFINCGVDVVIFTSGGSESDNLAIKGTIEGIREQGDERRPHIITSMVEHHAVLHTVQDLERRGIVEATYIKPDQDGLITPEMVATEIKSNTALISLIYVNNETGVVTPIHDIGLTLKAENEKRGQKIYFHTDAVQAAEFFKIDPEYLGVDMLTFTAHKFHGPKGIGVLYAKKGTPIKPQITGGDQEFRLRAGTENTAGIAGLAEALELIQKDRKSSENLLSEESLPELITSREAKRLVGLRDKLIQGIVNNIPDSILNGSGIRRSPNIINISFMNAEGEAIILNLDFLGIAVSSGSACTSRSLNPSHVLSAMGIPPEKAHGSIRISLGKFTEEADIDRVLDVLPGIIEKLRMMSPFK